MQVLSWRATYIRWSVVSRHTAGVGNPEIKHPSTSYRVNGAHKATGVEVLLFNLVISFVV